MRQHKRHGWKAWAVAAAVLAGWTAIMGYAAERYRIGIDPQGVTSLYGPEESSPRLYAVDLHDRSVERGELAAFSLPPRGATLLRQAGFQLPSKTLVKRVAALAGDEVVVDSDGVHISGQHQASGLALAKSLGQPEASFYRVERVPPGHVFLLGDDPASFDSRYYGAVPVERIAGKASILWSERGKRGNR